MRLLFLLVLSISLLLSPKTWGQERFTRSMDRNERGMMPDDDDDRSTSFGPRLGGDKSKNTKAKKPVPIGLKTWQVANDFGRMDSVVPDTTRHMFFKQTYTDGLRGEYNSLGNLGSPRISRLFALRETMFSDFVFAQPYDFFLTKFSDLHFTNTLSPITNLTYRECGNRTNGEDHFKALFAMNVDKDAGFGFKFDYIYGRGYYDHQSTSDFNFSLWGSVVKDRYKAHVFLYTNYLKNSENGGITDDDYVRSPENFPSSYDTKDIPTRLQRAWNKMHVDGLQLTHSYSLGFYRNGRGERIPDPRHAPQPSDSLAAPSATADSLRTQPATVDSLRPTASPADGTPVLASAPDSLAQANNGLDTIRVFVPVTSLIHTAKLTRNVRRFIANEALNNYYTHIFFPGDSTDDRTTNLYLSNQLTLELHEGCNSWALAGIRLYARHELNHFKLPAVPVIRETITENEMTIGASLFKEKGHTLLHYSLTGQTSSTGSVWGDFMLRADAQLGVKLGRDTLRLSAYGLAVNERPTLIYRKYHSHHLWWDNNLDKQMTARVGGMLSSERTRTRLSLDLQNIKNYTYFYNTQSTTSAATNPVTTMNTSVGQHSAAIQVLTATLSQDFKLGVLNWQNQLTYQTTSNADVLPLPDFSAYSNLFLDFRIARVLYVELGGDVRYFTSYAAPTYSPALGMFAVQDKNNAIKVGDHPIVDLYVNFHLQHTRFYLMASHVNYSKTGGNVFMAPHYPYNPFTIKFGISWNFFN